MLLLAVSESRGLLSEQVHLRLLLLRILVLRVSIGIVNDRRKHIGRRGMLDSQVEAVVKQSSLVGLFLLPLPSRFFSF